VYRPGTPAGVNPLTPARISYLPCPFKCKIALQATSEVRYYFATASTSTSTAGAVTGKAL
jgi:hypothetical protein